MKQKKIEHYYDAVAENYYQQYERENLFTIDDYPANYFRLQLLLNSFISKNIKKVLEVGVGDGTPLVTLAKAGMEVWGFDLSLKMVEKAKNNMKKNRIDQSHIFWADIQDSTTYAHCLKDGLFDGLLAMGVMPHVNNEEIVLKNMACCVKPGGSLFVEFRNKLFSLFTFNRHTLDFIVNDLLKDVDKQIKETVKKELSQRLRIDMPPVRNKIHGKTAPGYDAILSKFHNPFEVNDLFKKLGFKEIKFLWYHYHPAMPYLEKNIGKTFREEAFNLEHETSNWRGMFLCSAFVVEAIK